MKICFNNNLQYFKGCAPRYTNQQGFTVIPIAKNPSQGELNKAQLVMLYGEKRSGRSGDAYFYPNQPLVVKVSKEGRENCLKHEIDTLDRLYDSGIKNNPLLQEGQFAFMSPEGRYYLISNKLKGTPIEIENNQVVGGKLTPENIKSAVETLTFLDYPKSNGEELKKANLPFSIALHNDLCFENILVTPQEAEIIDFEHFQFDNMENRFKGAELNEHHETNCNLSDIPGMVSNLRGFELRTLVPYLNAIDKKEAKTLFSGYLDNKTIYHAKQAEKLRELNPQHKNYACNLLEQKHEIHSRVLAKKESDVVQAEAMKIQLANYVHIQSPFNGTVLYKFNPNQIKKYLASCEQFFKEQYGKAIENDDLDKKEYYLDCIFLHKTFSGILDCMSEQIYDDLFNSKLTDEYLNTLDEIVS